jgi:hypothetical protein
VEATAPEREASTKVEIMKAAATDRPDRHDPRPVAHYE